MAAGKTKRELEKIGEKTRFSSENQPENPGRHKKLPELDVLLAEVLGEDPNDPEAQSEAKAVLKEMVKSAKKGNVQAQIAVLNRAYGMPKQPTELTGANNGPIQTSVAPLDAAQIAAIQAMLNAGNGKTDATDKADTGKRSK